MTDWTKSCDDPECECRDHVVWPDNLPCPYINEEAKLPAGIANPIIQYQLIVNECNAYPLFDTKADAEVILTECQKNYPELPAKVIEVKKTNIYFYMIKS